MLYNRSGNFLGRARSFIQRKFPRGEYITWGSHEVHAVILSAYDIDNLAQNIAQDVVYAMLKELDVCDNFEHGKLENFRTCTNCGYSHNLHELKQGRGRL